MPGYGTLDAKYVIIGEAPGREEDLAGCPFVGRSGKRLNEYLALARIDMNQCYLTNTVRCRPPENRTPKKKEQRMCLPFLHQEIMMIQPEYVITLGAVPLGLFSPYGIKTVHGTQFEYPIPGTDKKMTVLAMYHPAAAFRQPRLKSTMLDDWENLPKKVDASYVVTEEFPRCAEISLDTENDPDGTLGQWSMAYRDDQGRICVKALYRPIRDHQFLGRYIMHNSKWDIRVLERNGMKAPADTVDTMVAAYCLGMGKMDVKTEESQTDVGMVGGLGLKYLARRHLGMQMKTWEEVYNKPDLIPEYNAADSVSTLLLWEQWKPKLPEHFWTIDTPLTRVLMAMEDRGISLDPRFMTEYSKAIDEEMGKIELPPDLNPYSTKDVQKYVYTTLGIEPFMFTDTKQPSVAKEVLETIDDPVVKKIVRYKELYQEKNTYIKTYMDRLTPEGKIHCEFKQTSTATGRLSSAKPNLQNVPKENSTMRSLFVAPQGKLLVRADYSQIELRVFAALTGDEVMQEVFQQGRDIHQETSDFLVNHGFKIDRSNAKIINFLMLYKGEAWKLSREYNIPIDQAKEIIEWWYRKYPKVKQYQDKCIEEVRATKRMYTHFGRCRRIDALYADDWRVRKEGEKEGINMPIQGTAGEIVKLAMIDLHYKHSAPMLLQVHDELVFEIEENKAKDYAHWLGEYLPNITTIEGINFPVEVGVGRTWLEAMKSEEKIGS